VFRFADQFRDEGTDVVYRYGGAGRPVTMSNDERDAFIADYIRKRRIGVPLTWVWLGTATLIAIFWQWPNVWAIFMGSIVLSLPGVHIIGLIHRRWHQKPETEKYGRTSARAIASRSSIRDAAIKKMPWWSISVWLLIGPLMVFDKWKMDITTAEIATLMLWAWLFLQNAYYAYLKLRIRKAPVLSGFG
jgi:hypothetical protein